MAAVRSNGTGIFGTAVGCLDEPSPGGNPSRGSDEGRKGGSDARAAARAYFTRKGAFRRRSASRWLVVGSSGAQSAQSAQQEKILSVCRWRMGMAWSGFLDQRGSIGDQKTDDAIAAR